MIDPNWMHEHSYFCAVDVPSDIEFCEFIFSNNYGLTRFREESRKAGIPLTTYTLGKFKEWQKTRGNEHGKIE